MPLIVTRTFLLDSATELEDAGLTGTKRRYRIGEQSRARQIADDDAAVRIGSANDMVCRRAPGARRQVAAFCDDDVVGRQDMIAGTARARYVRIRNRVFNFGPWHWVSRAADSGRIDHRGRLVESNEPGVDAINRVVNRTRCVGRSGADYDIKAREHAESGRSSDSRQEVCGSTKRDRQANAAIAW